MILRYENSTDKDIESIYSFNKQLIDQYEDIQKIDYEKVLKWVYNKIKTNIHEYTSVYLENQLVGFYRFHEEEGIMEIDDLYLFESYRNKKIGSTILNKCIQETNKPIILYVFIKNTKAVKLYERFGFQIIKNIQNSRYIMRKD